MHKKNKKNVRFLKIIGTIIKFLYILSLIFVICGLFVDKEKVIYSVIGYSFIIAALISIILTCKYPESIELPNVKAYKFKMNFDNCKSLISYIDNNVNKIKFKKFDLNSYRNFVAYYYVKKGIIRNKVEYFIVLKKGELVITKEEFLEEIDKIRNEIIEDIEFQFKIKVKNSTYISENYILLVDKETEEFKKILNTNVVGGFRYAFLICGYSFDSKILYVSNQKDGQFFNYIYIRNKFLKVMNIKMNESLN